MRPEKVEEAVPVALYIRSMAGDPAHTLENQLRALQKHAARNGMQQVRVYFDTRDDRSQFDRMMAEATGENPPFRRILVLELSRFALDSGDLDGQLARLDGRGVAVEPMTGPTSEAPGP